VKILLGSHFFSPSVGGIETCSLTLAREFRNAGHEVRIVTQSVSHDSRDDHGFYILRKPKRNALRRVVQWCDVFYQNNLSLQTAWPLAFIRKPWFVTTQTWLGMNEQAIGTTGKFKNWVLRFAYNIYISDAIAKHIGHPGPVLGNPYDHETFRLHPEVTRDRDVVFLGRLVSDKGCDLLIEALKSLKSKGVYPTATIIGDGPDRQPLEQQALEADLQTQVRFVGKMSGDTLAKELNRHRVIAIPSRWNEPFGIVALEGMACGCFPVVSSGGGLPEATGGFGVTFNNSDANELARAIATALDLTKNLVPDYSKHLVQFQATVVAARYLSEFANAIKKS
jgi:glycogen(starch) synthase